MTISMVNILISVTLITPSHKPLREQGKVGLPKKMLHRVPLRVSV